MARVVLLWSAFLLLMSIALLVKSSSLPSLSDSTADGGGGGDGGSDGSNGWGFGWGGIGGGSGGGDDGHGSGRIWGGGSGGIWGGGGGGIWGGGGGDDGQGSGGTGGGDDQVLVIGGEAKTICQGKCEDIPDCNGFCKRIGFNSGKCFPPLNQYCCCQQ